MPTEVLATPRADQQIAGLDRTHARAFGEFLDDLAARGCQALGYRLSGPAPVDHLCVKHLRDSLRVVVAFEGQQRAWILLVGRHDDQDPVLNVYAELYRLLGVEPPDSAGRDKPPCCDESTDLPPVLGAAVTELVDRAARVRRTRRQATSLRVCAAVVGQRHGDPALPAGDGRAGQVFLSLKRRPNKRPILPNSAGHVSAYLRGGLYVVNSSSDRQFSPVVRVNSTSIRRSGSVRCTCR